MLLASCTEHLFQAMNGNNGIFKKGREGKIILRDRVCSSMPLEQSYKTSSKESDKSYK